MATTYNHVELSSVDSNGNVNVLYPQSNPSDVVIKDKTAENIPKNVNNLQEFLDIIGSMAFENRENMVFMGESENLDISDQLSEINDNISSDSTTWSSNKIRSIIDSFKYYDRITEATLTTNYNKPVCFSVNVESLILTDKTLVPESSGLFFVVHLPLLISEDPPKSITMSDSKGTSSSQATTIISDLCMQIWIKCIPNSKFAFYIKTGIRNSAVDKVIYGPFVKSLSNDNGMVVNVN